MKCDHCNKKIKSVYPTPCKCKKYFCKKHKYNDQHDCSYDYKNAYKGKLKTENKKVEADKLERM